MDWSSMFGGMMGGGGGSGGGGGKDKGKASMMGFDVPSVTGMLEEGNDRNASTLSTLIKSYGNGNAASGGTAPTKTSSGGLSDALKGLLGGGNDKPDTSGGNPYADKTGFMSDDYQPLDSDNLSMYDNNGFAKKNYGLNLGNVSDSFND